MIDLRGFIDDAEAIVARARLGRPGAYARHAPVGGTALGPIDPYGCSDAANILYTIGRFPRGLDERAGFVAEMQKQQEPDTGLWRETTHHPIHTTAHCLAALELFDAGCLHPLTALAEARQPGGIRRFLDDLNFLLPWHASHQGAGVYAALVLAGEATPAFQEAYFAWMAENRDPATGLICKGAPAPVEHSGVATLFPHLAGSFHYLFNHQYARRPWPNPDRFVDTCFALRRAREFPLAKIVGFAEIDWVYCLNRCMRQNGYAFGDGLAALEDFAEEYGRFLVELDRSDDRLNDLHMLFGALCCLAELQQALPGKLVTERPLKLVLDRRPFI